MFSDHMQRCAHTNKAAAVLLSCLFTTSMGVDADSMTLQAKPETCVALHRGQVCYRDVSLSWNTPAGKERYCLELDGRGESLTCWAGNEIQRFRHQYASNTIERYLLISVDPYQVLSEATIKTAWVYRSNRRGSRGWRLF